MGTKGTTRNRNLMGAVDRRSFVLNYVLAA